MPDRILRAAILTSQRVDALSWGAEVFYRRLMSVIDDFGRYDARTSVLRAHLYPLKLDRVKDDQIEKWLTECVAAGLICSYIVDGKEYLQLERFDQRVRAQRSKFPPPGDGKLKNALASENCGHLRASADIRGHPPPYSYSETYSYSEAHSEKSCTEASEADAAVPDEIPPAMFFPIVGPEGAPKEWPLYPDKIADYQAVYPGIDAMAEARKARQWCVDNKSRRKTAKGMGRFLNSWMAKAQDESAAKSVGRPGAAGASRGSSGAPNMLQREQAQQDQQLGTIDEWVAKRSGAAAMQPGGLRPVDGLPHGNEAHRRIDGPAT